MKVGVIGVGTRHGDDAVGLEVARLLEEGPVAPNVRVLTCGHPGLELPELLEGLDAAIVIDATRSGAPAGCVRRVHARELARRGGVSSHGWGVPEGLRLARALGRAPGRLELVGIEAEVSRGEDLSPAARRALPRAVRLVRRLLDEVLPDA